MTLDPFEIGRKKQCAVEENEQRRQQRNSLSQIKAVGRLFSMLSPKVEQLGLAIWLDDDLKKINIHTHRHFQIRSGSLIISNHFKDGVASDRWNIYDDHADGSTKYGLSDEDAFEFVGEYCEANIERARYVRQLQEKETLSRAQMDMEWKAEKRSKFWAEHWFLFACGFMVLLVLFSL